MVVANMALNCMGLLPVISILFGGLAKRRSFFTCKAAFITGRLLCILAGFRICVHYGRNVREKDLDYVEEV